MVTRALLVLALLVPAVAHADDDGAPPYKVLRFPEVPPDVTALVALPELATPELGEEIASGIPVTILTRAIVYDAATKAPVATSFATTRVVYDLWQEIFLIKVSDRRGARLVRTPARAEALRLATTIDRLPLAPIDRLTPGRHYAALFVVEVNPISEELLAEVRRWLARGGGAGERLDAAFFSSVVSIFVNPRLDAAERTLRFRSGAFFRAVPR